MSLTLNDPRHNVIKEIEDTLEFNGMAKNYLMRSNGYTCGFNMPQALSGKNEFSLPPYNKRMSYLVDKYPACPSNWMRSEGKAKSYFVPIKEGHGVWLDFNENETNPYHVAIVISVQGVNPITGMPCKDNQLEQYIEECPKHKIKFGPDRYCKKCNYKWPKQNYISTTATPRGQLWIDGFRSIDGIVRQYILTQEKIKGVAANIIGNNRVFAIGLSFFISKDKKPVVTDTSMLRGFTATWYSEPVMNGSYESLPKDPKDYEAYTTCYDNPDIVKGDSTICGPTKGGGTSTPINFSYLGYNTGKFGKNTELSFSNAFQKIEKHVIQTKKLEVGAGAKIKQQIYDDPEHLDFWRNEAESILYINYCTEEDAIKIIKKGEVDLEGSEEGFLTNIKKGN